MNWVDYAIIAILVIGFLSGMKKGFILSLSNVIGVIVSIIAAKLFYSSFALFLIQNTKIEDTIMKILDKSDFLQSFSTNLIMKSPMFDVSRQLAYDMQSYVTMTIINAISMLCVFVLARLAMTIIESFLKDVTELPLLRQANRLTGGVLGVVKSLLVLFILFAVLVPVSTMPSWAFVAKGIEGSTYAKYFYQYNIALNWIWSTAAQIMGTPK